ncbi:MAG: hypothetical protein MJZ52_04340 [Bacteroidales bacterium]|nr:hypothetical protein [Bacteroidales bacterium]
MKKLLLCVIFTLFLLPLAVMGQCGTENLTAQDAEGTTFNSVKVGPHCWLKPNLSIKLDSSKIYKSEMYPDTDANLATFGRLYNWYTAMNVQPGQSPVVGEHGFVQGICPEGWHLPTEAETRELMNYDAKTLHATEHWFVPGTNTTGFTMLPGGYYNAMKKYGENLGGDCYMWSAQSLDPSNPTVIWSDCHCEYFLVNRGSAVNGMSVRCVYKIYQGEITTDSVKEITDQSATLYGTIAFSGYDEEYERGFVYGTDRDNLDQWAVESSTASEETAPFNTEITGLTVATTYYYQAYIVNDFDTAWGEVKNFTTTGSSTFTCGTDKVKDVQENEYPTVQIGKQCWMAQNLRTKIGGTGDKGYPEDADADTVTYGRLYTWTAVTKGASTNYTAGGTNDTIVHGICPTGWHVPSDAEWDTLTYYVYNSAYPDYKCSDCTSSGWEQSTKCIANALSAPTGWKSPNDCGAGSDNPTRNLTGFSAVPAGNCFNGSFGVFGSRAYFWSATQGDVSLAWYRDLRSNASSVGRTNGPMDNGISVRCLKDKEVPAAMSVTTDSANTVTSNSAKLYGNVTNMGGKDNVYAGFKYGTSESALTSIAADESAMYATGRFSYTITSLTANTQYYFKAFAANGTDTVYGEVKNFRTLSNNPCPNTPTVTDIENNVYNTVQIGNQCWMAQNLRTKIGGDGDKGYPTEAGNDTVTYGRLYTWSAMMNGEGSTNYPVSGDKVQGICPTGWHVPSNAEWDTLTTYVNGVAEYRCGETDKAIANALSAATGWQSPSECGAGHNSTTLNKTGFSAVPAGSWLNDYVGFGYGAYFWSATQDGSDYAYRCGLNLNSANVGRSSNFKRYGFSVRCLRDEEAPAAMSVTTDSANTVTNNTATLHGTVTNMGGKDNVYAGFKYGTSESALTSIAADESAMYATGRFSYTITGLTTNTKYYFKAFAANGTDTVYGEVKNFTTNFICGIDSIKDADNNWYHTVNMAGQCWMKENLKTTNINGKGAYYPTEENDYVSTYGRLYNWTAAMQGQTGEGVRGICPENWHLPTDAEWKNVESAYLQFAGGSVDYLNYRGTGAGKFTGSNLWGTGGSGTCPNNNAYEYRNITNFTALPAGYYNGSLNEKEIGTYFWTSTSNNDLYTFIRNIDRSHEGIKRSNAGDKAYYYSVRCLRDPEVLKVTTDSANTVTKNSAKLHGNVTNMGGKDNVYAGFKYGTSESTLTSIVVKDAAMTATGLFSCDITGLTANTQYYFKAFAANGTDTVYGEVKDFKTMSFSCLGTPKANERGITDAIDSVVDVDGNAYNTVQIGNQCWMAENLRTTKYAGGTGIKLGSSTSTETAYRYNPGNSSDHVSTYGYLYNWPAVMNTSFSSEANPSGVQGVCPTGWHVPSDAEWDTLTTYVNSVADYKCNNVNNNIANALSAATGWQNPSECCAGSEKQTLNKTGFSAVPAGFYNDVDYFCFGSSAYFWSATQYNSDFAYYRYLDCNNASVSRESIVKYYGYSVRCLRDEEAPAVMSVTTDSANTVTNNTATLHGTVTNMGGKDNVYAGFKYGTSESTLTSIVVKDAAMTATGLFSCDITGLTANTQYYFKAFAANGTDTVYGEVKNFTTNFICGIDSIKDADNNWYHTVNMAGQCWMKENLRTTTKRKGVGNIYTGNTQTGYNAETYGYYYNWAAVMQNESGDKVRGICPEGWHVPNDAEWNTLTTDVNVVADYRCGKKNNAIANALSSPMGWQKPSECGAGHNSTTLNKTGFSAVPAGSCVDGSFNFFGTNAYFWSATQGDDGYAWCRSLGSGNIYVFRRNGDKDTGFSVRCLKN